MRISHRMVALPIVDADAPTFDHGETEDKPSPAPNASRMSDSAAATNAPPITAAQDTPEECASFLPEVSAKPIGERATDDERTGCSMCCATSSAQSDSCMSPTDRVRSVGSGNFLDRSAILRPLAWWCRLSW